MSTSIEPIVSWLLASRVSEDTIDLVKSVLAPVLSQLAPENEAESATDFS